MTAPTSVETSEMWPDVRAMWQLGGMDLARRRRARSASVVSALVALVGIPLTGPLLAAQRAHAQQNLSANCPEPGSSPLGDGRYAGELRGVVVGHMSRGNTKTIQVTRGTLRARVERGRIVEVEGSLDWVLTVVAEGGMGSPVVASRASGPIELVDGGNPSFKIRARLSGSVSATDAAGAGHAEFNRSITPQEVEYALQITDASCRSVRGAVTGDSPDRATARALRRQGFTVSRTPPTFELRSETADELERAENELRAQLRQSTPGVVQRRDAVMRRWGRIFQQRQLASRGLNGSQQECLRATFVAEVRRVVLEWLDDDRPRLANAARNAVDPQPFQEVARGLIAAIRELALLGLDDCTRTVADEVVREIAAGSVAAMDEAIRQDRPPYDVVVWARQAMLLGAAEDANERGLAAVCNHALTTQRVLQSNLESGVRQSGMTPRNRQLLREAIAATRAAYLVCGYEPRSTIDYLMRHPEWR